ncbi:MAG: penicillin-binding transpeptidase domain-containing protein [Patescibacteria group bacterium]
MVRFKDIKKIFSRKRTFNNVDIAPDEILIDASNLPEFDQHQFEGRIEKPISPRIIIFLGFIFLAVGGVFTYKAWSLQIANGAEFAERSENNSLRHTLVFSDRGVIYDRNKTLLAWNIKNPEDDDFSFRRYATTTGLSNLIGYIKYPSKDTSGFYYREDYLGMDGIEKFYNEKLKGTNGLKITETDVHRTVISQSVLNPPETGGDVVLSIDSRIQSKMYDVIAQVAQERGFTGGAGAMMDVRTGEIIASVTYPEYNSQVLTDGTDREKIQHYFTDKSTPVLDRVSSGLYTPGSIVKPFMSIAALSEKVITPEKVIYTTGSISLKNPYNPDITYVFRDWKNHGPVDMRKAIEQSSDVYFYEVGGGYQDQKGMGILNIEKYSRMFGFGRPVGSDFFGNKAGTIPSPDWKKATFDGEEWTVGNTYHSVIGQYGFQVTPLQVVRSVAAIANYGTLVKPTIISGDTTMMDETEKINLPRSYFNVAHEGMRQAAVQGSAQALNVSYVKFGAKTGTAELGVKKDFVNSWVTGFFPYENPKYSFVVLMERGPVKNLVGASSVSRQIFDWMNVNTPEYFAN